MVSCEHIRRSQAASNYSFGAICNRSGLKSLRPKSKRNQNGISKGLKSTHVHSRPYQGFVDRRPCDDSVLPSHHQPIPPCRHLIETLMVPMWTWPAMGVDLEPSQNYVLNSSAYVLPFKPLRASSGSKTQQNVGKQTQPTLRRFEVGLHSGPCP